MVKLKLAVPYFAGTFLSCLSFASSFSITPPKNGPLSLTTLNMAVWSDGKAVRDYKEFLESGKQEIELTADGPSVIIKPLSGSSELANGLINMGMGDDIVLTPDQDLPDSVGGSSEYPIYVTVPPTQLEDFLDNLSASYKARVDDFVFFSGGLQYGNIEDLLKQRGYCRDSMTQVLISGLRVTQLNRVQDLSIRLGSDSYDLEKWGGECTACGKWRGSMFQRMERSNIRCRVDFYREWRRFMYERNVYDAVFHLLGVVRSEPTTVADAAMYYGDEVSDLVWEFSQLLRGWKALTLMYGFEERIFGVADMAEQKCTVTDEMYPFIWGNPVFLQSKSYMEYLQYAKEEMGVLQSIDLPKMNDDDFKSKMRQGNLRADGVI